jgi:acyl-CoA thioesterase-1
MRAFKRSIALAIPILLTASIGFAGSIRYELALGSTIPVLVDAPAGLTVSNLGIGAGMGNLFDNGGGADSLRISGNDVQGSSVTAMTTSAYLSFSVTIPAGVTVNLTSLALDYQAVNVVSYSNARVFSTVDGFDNVTADTIGVLGRSIAGSDAVVVHGNISLVTPESNPTRGANVTTGEFDGLTDTTITFYLPWIDGATTTAAYTDIDNLELTFDVTGPGVPLFSEIVPLRLPDGSVRLDYSGANGQHYSLLTSDDLSIPLTAWPALTNDVLGVSAEVFIDRAAQHLPRRYYVLATPLTRIMCVGDSITEGSGSFPAYRLGLWRKLTAAGHSVEFVGSRVTPNAGNTLEHEGYGGKTAEYVASVLPVTFAAHPADVVLIHSGHNHFDTDNPPDGPVPLIVEATESMIDTCRALNPEVTVLVAQVITSNKLPKYSYIPDLNVALAALAARKHTLAQPVYAVDLATGFNPATDTITDLVHPNAAGSEKMATKWFEALDAILP